MSLLQRHNQYAVANDDDDDDADNVDDSLDLDSNDGFGEEADDDNLSFDDSYDNEFEPESTHEEDQVHRGAPVPQAVPPYYPGMTTCIVCRVRPPYNRGGKSYPTCGLTCAGVLEEALNNVTPGPGSIGRGHGRGRGGTSSGRGGVPTSPSTGSRQHTPAPTTQVNPNMRHLTQHLGGHSPSRRSPAPQLPAVGRGSHRPSGSGTRQQQQNAGSSTMTQAAPLPLTDPCVVCRKRPCYDTKYVTCGLTCAEKLSKGGGDAKMCDYCHRRPKLAGHNQCGQTCRDAAKVACLLCKCRPKFKRYHLCGKTCKQISTKSTPLILEVPEGHDTYQMVMKKYGAAWKYGTQPKVVKIFKIIESKTFLQPYDRYKKSVGTEVFRYHGTRRKCTVGSNGNKMLCNDSTCPLCSILKSSFKTSLANPSGAFGAGIYTSSAANKAYSYSDNGKGALLLTKVILGKPYPVTAFGQVSSCPAGYNSVVFDRNNGSLNETIIYSDDAIRPVFLLMFY